MSEIEIVGAKIVGGLFCHYTFREDIGKNRHDYLKVKSERPIHDDLRNAFAALNIHLPVILEDLKAGDIPDINTGVNGWAGTEETLTLIERFTVIEFERSIEENCAQLMGTKVLALGKLEVVTPMISFAGGYHYTLELQMMIDKLIKEVELYREGKQAPEKPITDLFNQEQGDEGEEEKPKGKPGRKKKKKKKLVVGMFEDTNFPEYLGRDIISEEDAEEGDIIGIDANDGSPILKDRAPVSEPITNFQKDPKDVEP